MTGFWHLFITFFFSLAGLGNGILGLSPDTIAVAMNFWSAILVLVLGIALIFQISSLLPKSIKQKREPLKEDKKTDSFSLAGISIGRSVLLLWLTSGMGAFLVMVDNKTDLGVMALSLLALLSGIIFLGIYQQEKKEKSEILKYLIIAGVFFGFASLAKVTAFVDLAMFAIFLMGLWISPWTALGVGCVVTGLLRYMNILTSSFMLSEQNAMWLIVIGGILVVVGLVIAVIKRKKILSSIGYLVVVGLSFLVPLLLFKAPRLITSQVIGGNFSIQQTVKSLLAKNTFPTLEDKTLVAQATDESTNPLAEQNLIDEEVLEVIPDPVENYITQQQSAQNCLGIGKIYSEEELNEGLQEIK